MYAFFVGQDNIILCTECLLFNVQALRPDFEAILFSIREDNFLKIEPSFVRVML